MPWTAPGKIQSGIGNGRLGPRTSSTKKGLPTFISLTLKTKIPIHIKYVSKSSTISSTGMLFGTVNDKKSHQLAKILCSLGTKNPRSVASTGWSTGLTRVPTKPAQAHALPGWALFSLLPHSQQHVSSCSRGRKVSKVTMGYGPCALGADSPSRKTDNYISDNKGWKLLSREMQGVTEGSP